jgi:hypothetical protein
MGEDRRGRRGRAEHFNEFEAFRLARRAASRRPEIAFGMGRLRFAAGCTAPDAFPEQHDWRMIRWRIFFRRGQRIPAGFDEPCRLDQLFARS